ncbi:MAG: hypothetical protein CMB80_01040 [Flammeovirgaceae bacterium]|nr:hypothetical protein [Flammeovirgaceae bacterium]|tara:strand:+ start:2763 stop:2993 length:231 start_codon:yes stop_codon:yes gene_type:complete
MKIKWLQQVELEVVTEFDENADKITGSYCQRVEIDEVDEIDLDDAWVEGNDFVDMQFGDGSMAYSVSKEYFEVLEW